MEIGSGFSDLGFARVDHDRVRRRGAPEAIYCPGKTVEQILAIGTSLIASGTENILATRASHPVMRALADNLPSVRVVPEARLCILNAVPGNDIGRVAVVSRPQEDDCSSLEAVWTARSMGSFVHCHFDAPADHPAELADWAQSLSAANVIVVADGMGGSLPSIVAGLVTSLIIALPLSMGTMGGIPSLLGALNSCSPGVLTVNVDNGFGAGYAAHLVNSLAMQGTSLTRV